MINRVLIRVKVVQALYSYVLTRPDRTYEQAKNDLQLSFEKSYELYMYLLKLIIELTDLQDRAIDDARNKYLPTEEDLNPNTRFIDNWLVKQLRENEELNVFFKDKLVSWQDEIIFKRLTLDKILNSDIYKEYMSYEKTDNATDCEIWKQILKQIILNDEDVEDKLETMSLFWSVEDIDTMGQFVIKTIRRILEGNDNPIMPMFKDDEDRAFGEKLFSRSVQIMDENNILIDSFIKSERWDKNRVALMDRLIMCVAVTELKYFESIPTTVTLNEYIELAKEFSTPNSGQFVNGILHAVCKNLRERGIIAKP
ncbi:MAG: transcription antitermination factor NusB [Muribaculaceae bacterium]|nr:transcription antitermination factor NusB [Muribaculaceae bacterium]